MRLACLLAAAACGSGDSTSDDPPTTCESTTPWATAPPMAEGPTQETATVAVAGKIYVLGGFRGISTILDTVQVFDTEACAWSAGPPLPKPVHHANAVELDGTIYVLGALVSESFTPIGDAWAWNPATDASWRSLAPLPIPRGSAFTAALDGRLYVVGGLAGGNAVTTVSIYDPGTDTWAAGADLPAGMGRDHACGGVVGGKLYVTGGRNGSSSRNSASVFALEPDDDAWTLPAPMLSARGGTACGVIGDRIIVVGGEGNRAVGSGVFPDVEAFTPASNTWEVLAPMPTPRHGMGAAVWNGRLYIPGGAVSEGFGAVAVHEILTP